MLAILPRGGQSNYGTMGLALRQKEKIKNGNFSSFVSYIELKR